MPVLVLLIFVGLVLLTVWAQASVRGAFKRYASVPSRAGLTGAEVARRVMEGAGVEGVRVEAAQGFLTDHYDPRHKVLRLSPQVYGGRSVASMGIAAHEAGHAIQEAAGYGPLALRNLAVPTAGLGSALGLPLLILGVVLALFPLALLGLALFAGVVLFQLVTLPVEIDASRRAVLRLREERLVEGPEEEKGVQTMLTAAAMTYVAAALTGIFWLLYYGSLVLGGRR